MNALRIHSRAPALAGLVLASAAALAIPAAGQETAGEGRLVASHILDWERVGSPAISPDGSAVLYTRSHVDRKNDRWVSELWIVDADGGRNRFLTRGSSPVWSPDGTRIAFLAGRRGRGRPDLRPLDGRRGRHLADHPRRAHSPRPPLVAGFPADRLHPDGGRPRDLGPPLHARSP